MTQWIRGEYNTELKAATYTDSQGGILVRTGGSLPWRLNNPGNLRPRLKDNKPAPKLVKTHIGFAKAKNDRGEENYFLIFPDYETGVKELRANLKRNYSKKTIKEAINSYAPPKENKTNKYIDDVEKISGLDRGEVVGSLKPEEFERLVQAIIRIEGYDDQTKGSRQEKLLQGTKITLSNGVQPLANKELKLVQNGKEHKLKTDDYGRLPTLIHLPGVDKIELLAKNIKGLWENILSLNVSEKAKNLLLVLDHLHVQATTAPHQPSVSAKPQRKDDSFYVVQSGDTIGKIAKKFKVTPEKIKQDNQIDNINKIFPGQKLKITYSQTQSTPSKDITPNKTANVKTPQAKPTPKTVELTRSKDGKGSPLAVVNGITEKAPWMSIALEEGILAHGLKEGKIEHNYHKLIGAKGKLNTVPWCAAFVSYCLNASGASGVKSQSSQYPLHSRDFVKIDAPIYGAIMVNSEYFVEDGQKTGNGHVTFVYGKTKDGRMVCLGGNQNDQLRFSNYPEDFSTGKKLRKKKDKDGNEIKKKEIVRQKRAGFYIPVSYYAYYQKHQEDLEIFTADELNKKLLNFENKEPSNDSKTT